MKKWLKLILVSMMLTFISCEKTDLTQDETNSTESKINPTNPVGIGYTDVKAWYINNGLTSSCTKNILVFPSWARYNQVIDYLDQQTETYCDAFDAQQPTPQTDDQYDDACLAANFDEDNKLVQFENGFTFCSLRRMLNTQEDAWLELQGDDDWDLTNDPDNHFIDDYTERSMLNEGVEVIIGPTDAKRTKYTLYKFTGDGEFYTISLTTVSSTNNSIVNQGAISALQQINNGTYVAGSNPDVVFIKEDIQSNCNNKVVYSEDYTNASNTSRFIAKSVMKKSVGTNCPTNGNPCTSIFPSKIKAQTRGFHKKNGKWKRRRTWIIAEVCGETPGSQAFPLIDCVNPSDGEYAIKNKKRRRVKAKVKSTNYIPPIGIPSRSDFTVTEANNVFSRHSQSDYLIMHNFNQLSN